VTTGVRDHHTSILTRADLAKALGVRDGAQVGAIDQAIVRDRPEVRAIGIATKGAGLAMFLAQDQRLDTSMAPTASLMVPRVSLKKDVQTTGYPAGGGIAFVLL
jgi:hypothetical protein